MLSVNDWKKQKDLLAAALELDPDEREKLLSGSDIDADTRAEIESLLKLKNDAGDFLSVPASGFSGDFFVEENNGHLPAQCRLGVYEIVAELGSGGMGAVYLAERRDGKFSRQVAIKMLRREFDTVAIRKNFEREKDILAALSHPNIAGLLDTGQSDEGVPYLVMEYVDGLPVDEFCSQNRLDLTGRLKLFNKICDAVAFAHRNLIVHRDIKPSNILVTKDGVPKLLDFGISKILDADAADSATTLLGAMTPEYASPEQINGQTVTTATDVYSLGIVLYKMLTGAHPFKRAGQSNNDLFRAITGDEPTAPSAIPNSKFQISDSDNLKSKIPNPKSLTGDLDNIILKSIRKNPERRYGSVEQFSADIWRYIDGKPVEARAATRAYQLSKFYKRNKIAVTAGVLLFVTMIAGVAASAWQTSVARANAAAAAIESDNAKAEQKRSEKISKFMFKVIAYANPAWYAEGHRFGGGARVIDALEDLSDKIDVEFASEPDVAAELHHRFNEVYIMVGRNESNTERKKYFDEKHISHALRAYELRRQFYGEWHELVAKDMFYANYELGKNDKERAEVLAKAIEMMRSTNPNNLNLPYMLEGYAASLVLPDFQDLHDTYRQSAVPPTDENNYAVGERYLREAISLFRFHYKEDNYATLGNECVLAYALLMQDKWSDFDEHYGVCKQGQTELNRTEYADGKGSPTMLDLIEQKIVEKRGSSQR